MMIDQRSLNKALPYRDKTEYYGKRSKVDTDCSTKEICIKILSGAGLAPDRIVILSLQFVPPYRGYPRI
jgi:hypothetical protein